MDKDLISIIVPIFNTEKCIQRCIDSLIKQTYQNLEILLINDGSNDKSEEICKKNQKVDNRIKYFYKENGGVSSARNLGLENSKGNYILFVDSDDYIEEDMVEILYKNLIDYDADISMCSINIVNNKNNYINYNNSLSNKMIFNQNSFRANMEDTALYYTFPWNKLLKRDIIGNIRFRENLFYNEDGVFLYDISYNLKKAIFDGTKPLYNYIQNNQSATRKKINEKYLTIINAYDIVMEHIIDFNEKNKMFFYKKYIYSLSKIYFYYYEKGLLKDTKKKNIKGKMKSLYIRLCENREMTFFKRMKIFYVINFPILYNKLK